MKHLIWKYVVETCPVTNHISSKPSIPLPEEKDHGTWGWWGRCGVGRDAKVKTTDSAWSPLAKGLSLPGRVGCPEAAGLQGNKSSNIPGVSLLSHVWAGWTWMSHFGAGWKGGYIWLCLIFKGLKRGIRYIITWILYLLSNRANNSSWDCWEKSRRSKESCGYIPEMQRWEYFYLGHISSTCAPYVKDALKGKEVGIWVCAGGVEGGKYFLAYIS